MNTVDNEELKEWMNTFLLKEDEINSLSQYVNQPNIFEILNVENYEIRHSKVLAWLLDPTENHELGDAFLHEIIRLALSNRLRFA
jgi:hypothetical protein